MYFVWYDESRKKTTAEKIEEATAVYVERFKMRPSLVLVNAADLLELSDMVVRVEQTVQPNTFWLGRQDGKDLAQKSA